MIRFAESPYFVQPRQIIVYYYCRFFTIGEVQPWNNKYHYNYIFQLFKLVLCVVLGQMLANKCDYISYLKADNSVMLSLRCRLFQINLWPCLFFPLKCMIKQLLDSVFMKCKVVKVSLVVISLAFGLVGNSYLDIDNSVYHKNLIQ